MGRASYTEEQLDFLRAFRLFKLDVITGAFNLHFGTGKAIASIQAAYKNHKIKRLRTLRKGKPLIWTPDMVAWLRENYPVMTIKELTASFNATFNTNFGLDAVKSTCGRYNIASGRTGQIETGSVPWNKGVKGYMGANATSFKKGSTPPNRKDLWSERICSKDGFIIIKVPERDPHTGFPTRYKHKHVWIWEQANGPIPEGMVVAFVDSDKRHCAIENLMLITRNELLLLNLHKYKDQPAEVRPSILALVKLEAAAGIRTTGRVPGAGRKRKEAQ